MDWRSKLKTVMKVYGHMLPYEVWGFKNLRRVTAESCSFDMFCNVCVMDIPVTLTRSMCTECIEVDFIIAATSVHSHFTDDFHLVASDGDGD